MGRFDVGIHALRGDAQVWDEASGQLRQLARKVGDSRIDRLQAGIFQVFVSAYRSATDQVAGRSTEGVTALATVADTISKVADEYQDDEAANTHGFTDLH